MAISIDPSKLCPRCMQQIKDMHETCPHCGFQLSAYRGKTHHIHMHTILNGRYLMGAVLGEGGFGITYAAFDLKQNMRVAIKELFIKAITSRQGGQTIRLQDGGDARKYFQVCLTNFMEEAKILHSLNDKSGVVNVYRTFQENGTAYIVMEYLDGVDLRVYLSQNGGRLTWERTFVFLRPVMKSMMEIHQRGIIHRDIAPDNIRYTTDHHMKLMDFGSAKATSGGGKDTVISYKPGYAPREQYSDSYMFGQWMDVYAMCATIYRCITGKKPKESIDRVNDQDLESPISLGADISPELEQVIYKGMSLEPGDRYVDMRQLYYALKPFGPEKGDTPSVSVVPENTFESGNAGLSKEQTEAQEGYQKLIDDLNKQKRSYVWVYVIFLVELAVTAFLIYWFIFR